MNDTKIITATRGRFEVFDIVSSLSKLKALRHFYSSYPKFILKKYKIKNKLTANNLTSLIINTYHFLIFYFGIQSINLTNVQLYLLGINIIVYICLYIFLNRFNKNLNK